jgi:putative DNA primase/helicase
MTAEEIARALGGRKVGTGYQAKCPAHADGHPSLSIHDSSGGSILVRCHAGCSQYDVIAALKARGLLGRGGSRSYYPDIAFVRTADIGRDFALRTARALNIWRGAESGADTIVRRYLASRELVVTRWPTSLRFHPHCPRPRDDAGNIVYPMPAMVALVEHVRLGPVAVHCTYLRRDGSKKADLPKNKARACFGPVAGGAVRLGMPRSGEWFAVSEGIETGLSVALACSIPAWAALSAPSLKNLILPPQATHVIICADHDLSGTGQRAAHEAAVRFLAEGRRVRIAIPFERGTDFNDVFAGYTTTKTDEARDVS